MYIASLIFLYTLYLSQWYAKTVTPKRYLNADENQSELSGNATSTFPAQEIVTLIATSK